jgi:hypothetical protein
MGRTISPQATGGAISDATAEKLDALLFPPDSYTDNKSYWADLPRGQRTRWINRQNNAEAKRELSEIWTIFKRDPLEPLALYWRNYVVTGLGLFTEGFVLFSIGNLKPLFSSVWPECWSTHEGELSFQTSPWQKSGHLNLPLLPQSATRTGSQQSTTSKSSASSLGKS